MAAKKKSVRKRTVRKRVTRRKKSAMPKTTTRKKSAVVRAKQTIRKAAEGTLMEGLFERDKATNRKQHKAAQKKIDTARRELRRFQ